VPEIPELDAIRGFFATQLTGQAIAAVAVRIPTVVRTPAAELRESLPGDRFAGVGRLGKFLLFDLASGRTLAVNPMLTGRFQYVEPERRLATRTCLTLDIEGGHQFRYVDERVMGKVYLLPDNDTARLPGQERGGPDLLAPALDGAGWLARLGRYRGQIKKVLVNAEFVQGIGNAYADEILWEACINPYTSRTALDEAAQLCLLHAARAVMAWATPLVAERMVQGNALDYEERRDFLRVHRRGGQPCPRCGTPITEVTANGRITSYCRTCQPGAND
jgi:formamidopyrimidine-DNA glycosylase